MSKKRNTIKGVYKGNEPLGYRFNLTFDQSWSETPTREFHGSYKLIPTPSGSKAKPKVGCYRNDQLIFCAGARNGCYKKLLSFVGQTVPTKCAKRTSEFGEGHYLHINIEPVFSPNPEKVFILDTETTGIDKSNDEVLSLAVVDLHGNELFHDFIKPRHKKNWPDAQAINHISPSMVKDARHLDDRVDELDFLLDEDALIVGYNISFDLAMLRNSGMLIKSSYTYDVMARFASKHANGTYNKLQDAAACFDYSFIPHNALDDAKATAHIFRNMEKLTDNPIPYSKKPKRSSSEANVQIEKKANEGYRNQHNPSNDKGSEWSGCGCFIAIAILVVASIIYLAAIFK